MPWSQINGYTSNTRNSACSLCGTSQRTLHREVPEPVYTTGVMIEFEGTVDICHACLVEGAVLAGCATPEQVAALRAELEQAQTVAAEETARADMLEDVLEAAEKVRAYQEQEQAEPDPAPAARKKATAA